MILISNAGLSRRLRAVASHELKLEANGASFGEAQLKFLQFYTEVAVKSSCTFLIRKVALTA